jgi:2-keto-4-pentenoate hydratase/2-oxohepta-3-ene-1,7-dioic acid hydratase in catechol pathway
MKLASFAVDTPVGPQRRVGVADGDGLVDVTTAYAAALAADGEADPVTIAEAHAPPEMVAFLERGERAMKAAREAREYATDGDEETGPNGGQLRFAKAEVDLLAPVPRPNSLRDFMVYEEHVKNAMGEEPPNVWYEMPVYYKSNADSVIGTGVDVEWPEYSNLMDYELEIAAVIGKRGTDISADEAEEYIAGYTIFNDFSARDIQGQEMEARLGPAKGKDFANAFGPYLVTADAFDPETATMRADVDGETWSEGTPGEMYHSFADIIEHVSQSETLHPGDVLGSGTVGEGCGLELGQFLESGNTVTLHVEGIGTLENTVR